MPSLWQRVSEAAKAFRLGPAVVATDSSFSYTAKPDVRYGDLLEQSVGVYACANLRATTISSLPIIVYQQTSDGQRERVTSGPVVDLLAGVNPHWTFPHLLEMVELSLCLWGSAFLIVEKDRRGTPIELWWARPDKMTVVPHPTDYIAGYVYEQHEKKIAFQTDEVVWIRYPNPANEYAGLSPIASARMSVELGRAGLIANRKLFDQGLMAGGVISPSNPDTTWPADKVQQLQELLSRRMAGLDRAHRWMVIGHQMNAEPMGVSPRDAEFIEQMRLSLGDICRVFQVPPILVQDLEKGTYSNFEQSLKALWTLCLVPEAHRITHWLNEQLLPMFGEGLSVEFDFSGVAVLQEGQDAKWAREDGQIKAGAITVNEWRASRSMEPLPWGDQWWASAGLIPVGGDGQIGAEAATRSFSGEEWKFGGIAHIAHWKRNDARVARQVTAFRGMIEDFLDEQAKRVVSEMRKAEKAFSIADPFDIEAESEALAARATPYIRRAVQVSGDGVWAELGLIGAFDVRSPLVTEFIRNRAQRFATQVNETTWERLRGSLADGIDAGEGVDALSRRVIDTMELRKNQSAETIARTEVGGADNGGALEAAKQSGVVSGKQWIAAIDSMTRDTHVAAHLETVPLDADFSLGGPAPGQIGDAAEDINCRCVMRFVTELSGPQEP